MRNRFPPPVPGEDEILARYEGLIHATVSRKGYRFATIEDRQDVFSEVRLYVLYAIRSYEPGGKASLQTWVISCLQTGFKEAFRNLHTSPGAYRKYSYLRNRGQVDSEESQFLHRFLYPDSIEDRSRNNTESTKALLTATAPWKEVLKDPDAEDGDAVVERLSREDRRDALAEALDSLPERERHVILRHDRDGMTYKGLEKEMEVSESRVYQLYTQGRNRLRQRFATETPTTA